MDRSREHSAPAEPDVQGLKRVRVYDRLEHRRAPQQDMLEATRAPSKSAMVSPLRWLGLDNEAA